MVFQGLETARQIVEMVEHLAECKSQLEDVKAEGGSVVGKLEDITSDLADIAHRLFKYSLSTVEGEKDQISEEKVYIPDRLSHGVTNIGGGEIDRKNWKSAKICQFGIKCGFGRRGICGFYHPEEGKSREPVCTTLKISTQCFLLLFPFFRCWMLLQSAPLIQTVKESHCAGSSMQIPIVI